MNSRNKRKFWDERTAGPIKAIHPSTGKIIEVDPQKDAKVSSDLTRELMRIGPLYGWYAQLRDQASTQLREARYVEHCVDEDVYAELRAKNPKATETVIKMAVRKDPRMRKAFRERMDAEEMHEKLKSAVDTMVQKGYALTNLTNLHRTERSMKDSVID